MKLRELAELCEPETDIKVFPPYAKAEILFAFEIPNRADLADRPVSKIKYAWLGNGEHKCRTLGVHLGVGNMAPDRETD